ncbi:ArsR/SmtB family transcription factor [Mesorhizobium australicum]|uniref:Transcriptional regulator, ArsR family n=1 Tax=Mesorhizobium australicum TaxID=536018 RepID=A0A1X7NB48_9HYPH|nr:metalloregulator ArsR/SmtB family transcription factor [Mesorhizobium australicum]SMH34353.1 transcriptional regulator, ArsR family [Mesorhizobium australicum]
MVEQQLDTVFHALSDPTRRRMLARLSEGARSIGDLATPLDMSFAGASKHVRVLEKAGLVRRHVVGRTHWCHLEALRLKEARDWIDRYERFWTGRLDILEDLLRADLDAEQEKGKPT